MESAIKGHAHTKASEIQTQPTAVCMSSLYSEAFNEITIVNFMFIEMFLLEQRVNIFYEDQHEPCQQGA